jgi:uncharacterized protein YcbX
MLGSAVDELLITERGALGDRAWALRDLKTGRIASAKKFPRLLEFRAQYETEPTPTSHGHVTIEAPDGRLIQAEEPEASATPQQQCSIALWRGYVKAQFYAREQGDDGALLVSPFFPIWHFPWEHSEPLEVDPRARAALAGL